MPPIPNVSGSDERAELAGRLHAARLPPARRVLTAMYAGRLVLALGVFFGIIPVRVTPVAISASAAAAILGATIAVTLAAAWYSHRRVATPGPAFLYGQIVYDTLLVTTVVHLTGGAESPFAPLYILVICAAAILLPLPGGLLIGLFASTVYFADIMLGRHSAVSTAVLLQIVLFTVVALVTGYLGDRLRRTGAALGEVETELHLLRLDTGDILSSISTGILTVDGGGRLVYINPAAGELLHLAATEWLGRPILEELDRLAPGLGSVIARSADTRKAIRRFETDELPDIPFVLGVSTTLMDRPGETRPPVTVIFQDITEKKRAEALRRRAERLEAVAELSASLAHEIKNPLASIRSAAEQLASDDVDADDRAVLGRLVVRESNRLSRLLTEFIDFARVKVVAPEPVRLAEVVREVVLVVRAHPDAAGRSIEVACGADDAALVVRGAPDLMHRALLNLVLNAAQWAGPGGRVRVALDTVYSDILSPELGVSDIVRVGVADSGPGIPADALDLVFDPFFTLRPGGTGLGLALVQRAVEAHGGVIFVDNAPSADVPGAAFTMYLPAAAPAIPQDGSISDAA
jgi:two-component system, NtrC family, sensor histidine kinase PilS